MVDFNPDKERHVDHRWIVHKATQRPMDGVQTSKGFLKFNHEGRFVLKDEALASEIRSGELGKADVAVTRVRFPHPSDKGHNYFFKGIAMPWHKYDPITGQRIKEDG